MREGGEKCVFTFHEQTCSLTELSVGVAHSVILVKR